MVDSFLKRLGDKQFLQTGTHFTASSQKYFMNHIKRMGKEAFQQGLLNDIQTMGKRELNLEKLKPGHMLTYLYDAKWKDKLPYWDKFPLIFLVEIYKDGWLGINLHYLPLPVRSVLMRKLLMITNNDKFDERTRLKLSWQTLKAGTKFKEVTPCIKRYLAGHVRSNILQIPATEWEAALFLPVHNFQKKSTAKVWQDSRRIIREK